MTTKKPLLLSCLFVSLFLVLLSVFGPSGAIVNASVKARLDAVRSREAALEARVEALRATRDEASSRESLDDIAFSLGYNVEGDVVYYFDEPDALDPVTSSHPAAADLPEIKEGEEEWKLALVSLAVTVVVGVVWAVLEGRGGHDKWKGGDPRTDFRKEDYEWN